MLQLHDYHESAEWTRRVKNNRHELQLEPTSSHQVRLMQQSMQIMLFKKCFHLFAEGILLKYQVRPCCWRIAAPNLILPFKLREIFKMEMDDCCCKARYPQFLRLWPNLIIGNTTTPLLQTVAIVTKLPDSWPLKKKNLTKTAGSSIQRGHISLCSF